VYYRRGLASERADAFDLEHLDILDLHGAYK
jgi:hypothetical protein